MRPTDVCHPNDLRAPAPRVFPAPLATFVAGTPHGVLGSVQSDRGTGWFTPSDERFGGSSCNTELALGPYDHFESDERGRCLPTALMRSSL
jgi:hypothetical protein